MKKYLIIIPIIFALFKTNAQVGINTVQEPLVDLHVQTADPENPQPNEGIIIPRVHSLNVTDAKETGLLVFLDFEDPGTFEIEKGFYWWDGTQWVPFFSMNKLTKDRTITYVSCSDSFREGNITSNTSTDIRTMQFTSGSLIANDTDNFEVNANAELVVKKAGTYHLQAVVSLNSTTTSSPQARDAYEAMILVNGAEPSTPLRTAYGFPNGDNTYNSNSAISGFVDLNANDRISIRINRYYRKTGTTVTIAPNGNMSNLTLRYLGQL